MSQNATSLLAQDSNRQLFSDGFIWWPDRKFGFFPAQPENKYDRTYFDKYVGYANTPLGVELTNRRIELVKKYHETGEVVDIGIGCGQFIEFRKTRTFGYDVNPIAIRWLLDRGLWFDPYANEVDSITCFDSLEHIRRPKNLLEGVKRFVFISIPIFQNAEHARQSKHYRPDEHFWYFTADGLRHWMEVQGFHLLEANEMETQLGRDGIWTFTFERRRLSAIFGATKLASGEIHEP